MRNSIRIVDEVGDEAELLVYDVIDSAYGIGPKDVHKFLDENKSVKTLSIRINSPGGSVFDGTAMFSLLKSCKARKVVYIDGVAASMASVLAMCGDEIIMADNAFMMIHDPINFAYGDAEDMRDMAELLDKVKEQLVATYASRTKCSREQIVEYMSAESWFNA